MTGRAGLAAAGRGGDLLGPVNKRDSTTCSIGRTGARAPVLGSIAPLALLAAAYRRRRARAA
jgi:hypothetical protein